MSLHYEDAGLRLWHGPNLDILQADALGYPYALGYHPDHLIPDAFYDSIVTDPPYELGFMGKGWDSSGIAYSVEVWAECLRVLKPGGHLVAFGGTRTYHRVACAIEDAGFEIRDSIAWLYGSGFPKSMNVAKAIDATLVHGKSNSAGIRQANESRPGEGRVGAALPQNGIMGRQSPNGRVTRDEPQTAEGVAWDGWGTALKPAFEPIVVARKPLAGTVAANVLEYGAGALNIDATRVQFASDADRASAVPQGKATARIGALAGKAQECQSATGSTTAPSTTASTTDTSANPRQTASAQRAGGTERSEFSPNRSDLGRWPSNVVLSHAPLLDELGEAVGDACADGCVDGCPVAELDAQSGVLSSGMMRDGTRVQSSGGDIYGRREAFVKSGATYGDSGGASRFFPVFRYEAKAPTSERPNVDGTVHATVKPLALIQWLVRLITRPGGRVLDLYAGSGTTGEAALLEGMAVDLIELEAVHLPLILQRVRKPLQQSLFGDLGGTA